MNLVFLFLGIIIILYLYAQADSKENFIGQYGSTINTDKCTNLDPRNCLEKYNCGLCTTESDTYCASGDPRGPYNDKCVKWRHNDPSYVFITDD